MLSNCYLRKGNVYVPSVAKLGPAYYMDVEPVSVVPASNTEGVGRALRSAMVQGNPDIPAPARGHHPAPILPKYAGVKNWSAFARGTSTWSIKERDGNYEIAGHRKNPKGYWEEDPGQKIEFPPGTTVDTVIARMIAILQDAARP
jgi:hypothetical protein